MALILRAGVKYLCLIFYLGGIIKQGGFKVSFWEGVKRLSAEKLLRIIREYDHGKNCYPFEKVAFQVKSKEELCFNSS